MEFAVEWSHKSKAEPRVGMVCVRGDDSGDESGEQVIIGGCNTEELHACMYTIINSARNGICLKGCEVYITHIPCKKCAEALAQAGIKSLMCKEIPLSNETYSNYKFARSKFDVTFYKYPYAHLQKVNDDIHVNEFLVKEDAKHVLKVLQSHKVDEMMNDDTQMCLFGKTEQFIDGVRYTPHPLPDILRDVRKSVQRFTNKKYECIYLLKSGLKGENYGFLPGTVMVRLGPKNKFVITNSTETTSCEFVWRCGMMIIVGNDTKRCEAKNHSISGDVYTLIFTF